MLLFVVFHVDRSLGLADQHQNHMGDTKGGSMGGRGSTEDLARAKNAPTFQERVGARASLHWAQIWPFNPSL